MRHTLPAALAHGEKARPQSTSAPAGGARPAPSSSRQPQQRSCTAAQRRSGAAAQRRLQPPLASARPATSPPVLVPAAEPRISVSGGARRLLSSGSPLTGGDTTTPPPRLLTLRSSRLDSVESVDTPGAASSTSALYCENDALLLPGAVAATDTTWVYPAGNDTVALPSLPAAASSSTSPRR